ncbi:unnamed protein product [Closterium sp. NIES-53]
MSADRVVSLVRRRVEEYQPRAAREAPTPPPPPVAAVVTPFEDDKEEFVFSSSQLQKRVSASAAARAGGGGTSVGDEVDWYLAELPLSDVPTLQYWQCARNMDTLRQMARDYLAIPSTSAASKQAFSMGRNLISLHRHRLNTEHCELAKKMIALVAGDQWKGWAMGDREEEAEKFAKEVIDPAWWKSTAFFVKLLQ